MMAWTEDDGDGMTVTTLFNLNKWSEITAFCELVETNGEWTIELEDDSFTMDNPRGSSDDYLDVLFGINREKTIDTDKPLVNFRGGMFSFDVWEV
jgi:hypothetical protein|tara:strand:- start:113 stop:397 length:285 start_codon:yes stop_codon:yes gene_type:complete